MLFLKRNAYLIALAGVAIIFAAPCAPVLYVGLTIAGIGTGFMNA